MIPKKCDKILIRGVNWVGDAVMTMPAIRALKRAMPGSKLSLLVKPWVAALFEKDPDIDEIILYRPEHRGIRGICRLAGELKGRGFCLAVLFQNALEAALIAWLARIPVRLGYGRDARGILLTDSIDPAEKIYRDSHDSEYYLDLIRAAGVNAESALPWIYLTLQERFSARGRLASLSRPVIGMAPGAFGSSSRRWSAERFMEVAGRTMEATGGSVVLLGGPGEVASADRIILGLPEASQGRALSLAGKTTLRELPALISECDVLISNDSGPMHIGYAVRTPVVGIFGPVAPVTRLPSKGNIALSKEVGCAPCFKRKCDKTEVICMEAITPDEVFGAAMGLLKPNRAVFFDRDGTLCRDAHYLSRMEDFEVFSGISELKALKEKGFKLIGVSNQSGVARGLVDESFVKEINAIFTGSYGFDGFYYCPHHPDEHCSCRKPEPGMLFEARVDHGIDLKRSFVVGDKDVDMRLAKAAGAVGIHVTTGQEERAPSADRVARDLKDVVKIICG
ncbi:MAG: lipopolysaccharide heptosyltransferase II [Nitrospirae bacterium]|nr:lipopolysaccharide heptosyltransferase II [Nitrospirota bacterium]